MKGLVVRTFGFALCAALGIVHSAAFATEWVAPSSLVWRLGPHVKRTGDGLEVNVPVGCENDGGGIATADVDLSSVDGVPFELKVRAQGWGISKPDQPWLGLKAQVEYLNVETGEMTYPNVESKIGDFPLAELTCLDWRFARRKNAKLFFGLQGSSGRVTFDLSSLRLVSGADIFPQTNQTVKIRYPAVKTAGNGARGVMSPAKAMMEEDFRVLSEWGANLIRYQMTDPPLPGDGEGNEGYFARYDAWLNGKLDDLDSNILVWCRRYGVKVVVDLHVPPGGWAGKRVFDDDAYAGHFVDCWKRIALRFRSRTEIYGFDLMNEPGQAGRVRNNYWDVQRRAAEEIRKIDPTTPIIFAANQASSPCAFKYLSPLDMDNVIYEVHMYEPFAYTHNGAAVPLDGSAYPDDAKGWNKEWLRRELSPVRAFQLKHNARIYVGEFSAICWAPGAERWLADVISLFEEYGWDWSYHAFREWKGWSVEHEAKVAGGLEDGNFVPAETLRKKVLLESFVTNGYHVVDSFEDHAAGLRVAEIRGWGGDDCSVEAVSYTPPTPPGYVIAGESHAKVLNAVEGDAWRVIPDAMTATEKVDVMVCVSRCTSPTLLLPSDDIHVQVAADGEGRLCLWHLFREEDGVWRKGWIHLSQRTYAEGVWVRIGLEFDYERNPCGDAFVRVRVDGSCCPTGHGVRAPDDLRPYGAWHYLARNRCTGGVVMPSAIGFTGSKVDDLMICVKSVATGHAGATSIDGIEFSWFDNAGLPRDSKSPAPFIPGYVLADIYRTGIDPYSDRPFEVRGFRIDSEGRPHIEFNGYKGDVPACYRILRSSTPDFVNSTVLDSSDGAFRGDAATISTTWDGNSHVRNGAGFYKVLVL